MVAGRKVYKPEHVLSITTHYTNLRTYNSYIVRLACSLLARCRTT